MTDAPATEEKGIILVVDDLPNNLRLLSFVLKKAGYEVRLAPNGTMALASLERFTPDLILLDIMMPDLDGYEVCQQLKENPNTHDIPVIFLSALTEGEDKAKAFRAGGVDYVSKPFQTEEVLARVENQLMLRSLQKQLQQQNETLKGQNEQLQQAQRETRLLLDATQALSREESLKIAIASILELVCQYILWDYGEAWLSNSDLTTLTCITSNHSHDSSFETFWEYSQTLTFRIGSGLPGRVWQSCSPEWLEDCSREPESVFHRCQVAAETGLKAAFGVPILADEEVVAVLIFYQTQASAYQPRTVELVDAIATQLGELIQRKQIEEELQEQKAQTEQLLLNILPQTIAKRLQQGESPIADQLTEVTVLFADLVGFTEFSSQKTPAELVEILNVIFSEFDQLSDQYGLEKIKTIGDAYMVVGGVPTSVATEKNTEENEDIVVCTACMALKMQQVLAQYNQETGENIEVRIGIHAGAVVAGVLGLSKFSYDLWGDTVNIASRMESSSLPGKIQVTETVYERLKDQFSFEPRGLVDVKGKGEMQTYWLQGQ